MSERLPIDVLRCADLEATALPELLGGYGLEIVMVEKNRPIPGSFWGAPEAGLVGATLTLRGDTPVHSALHESGHYICMDDPRRAALHTNAGGGDAEECAVCYLSILLAERVPGYDQTRMLADMDRWGYSFRLGRARAWFETDAADARAWLHEHALIDARGTPTGRLRE